MRGTLLVSPLLLPYLINTNRKTRFVLRKKPAGKLISKTAHQIEREHAVLSALHRHNSQTSTRPEDRVPVPEPIVLCTDDSVIGTPFYIMEFLDGRIFTDVRMPEISPKDRREWSVYFASNSFCSSHASNLTDAPVKLVISHPGPGLTLSPRPPLHRPLKLRPQHTLLPSANQVPFPRLARTSRVNRRRLRKAHGKDTRIRPDATMVRRPLTRRTEDRVEGGARGL